MELFKVGVSVDDSLTDIVFMGSEGTMLTHKIPSTAPDLTQGVATGIKQVLVNNWLGSESITEIVHSTPVVMNALLKKEGAKTGVITTRGFRDMLGMGRGTTPTSYDLSWKKPAPPVPRYLVTEVNERVDGKGEIVHPLDIDEAIAAIDKLVASGVESVAVCLLNSVHNPKHEQKIGQLLRERALGVHVSLSTEVIPMIKEAERSLEVTTNACIAPVVANYMESLAKGLGSIGIKAPFYIMQSCGGLTTSDASVERPVTIIQGGPAASVLGARYLSNKLGIDDLITFDMGGAWAKASIITEGDFILANEYEVGARTYRPSRLRTGSGCLLRTPAIDIFELWCGCNSIIWLDAGGMLHVGPQSADAMSSTDCHGCRGKMPTLADAYVLLGYLDPDCLLGRALKLDSQKSYKVIEDKIARPLGIEPLKAAYGAYQIANSNMGRIIAAVCAERGRDVHDFTLLTFGCSGAIPAADVGQELGMKNVIIAPSPGIFSALGLLFADIERHFIRPFRRILVESTIQDINQVFQTMTDEAAASVERWGYAGAEVKTDRYADLRYYGQTTEIRLLIPDELNPQQLPGLVQRFNGQHQKLYGFSLPGTQTETVNLRLVASIRTPKPALSEISGATSKLSRSGLPSERKAYFGKQYGLMNIQVLAIEEVGSKPRQGPLIIESNDMTIIVPPSCYIAVGEYGSLMVTLKNQESEVTKGRRDDIIILALINNSLGLIIDKMDSLVVRTSPSAIQRDSHDFSCGIYNTKGETLCESDRLTHYSNRFSSSIGNWLQIRGIDSLHPGDMFILNDAFSGGSHFSDIFFAYPVFVDNQLVAWVSAGGHMLDLGGRVPGSMPADATSCYEEAIRLPFAKVYDRGIRNETFFEVLKANTRISDVIESHLEPFMAACRMGGNLFSRLVKKFGWKILNENLEELLNYSERRARADIRTLSDGVYEFEDYLDDYGPGTGPVRFHVKVTIDEDTITYDWTGTAPQVKAPINLPLGDTKGLVYTLFRSLINADIPHNGGEIRPLKLIIPEGTMVNPVIPAPVGQRGVALGRVYEVILGAQAQIVPDKMPACLSGIDTMLTLGGYNKERSSSFIFNHMPTGARGGSSCAGDGELTSPPFLDSRYKSIEVMEELYPIRFNQLALVPDSEGAGKYRGGFGYVVDYEILADETTLSLRTDRQRFAPFGVHGGQSGSLTSITLNPHTENRTLGKSVITMQNGDVLRVKLAGAGGWGNPLERDAKMVLDDVRNGLVSTRRAKETYGVVIDETTMEVDTRPRNCEGH